MDTFLDKISKVEIFNRMARDIKNCINTEITKKKKKYMQNRLTICMICSLH